jgi:hypothetical protein
MRTHTHGHSRVRDRDQEDLIDQLRIQCEDRTAVVATLRAQLEEAARGAGAAAQARERERAEGEAGWEKAAVKREAELRRSVDGWWRWVSGGWVVVGGGIYELRSSVLLLLWWWWCIRAAKVG